MKYGFRYIRFCGCTLFMLHLRISVNFTKPRPHSRNRKLLYCTLLLTLTLNKSVMASTDQPPLDPTEKDTWEKLSLWDRRADALAPLTEKQMDSVLELRAAAETLSVPSEVRCACVAS